MALHKVLEQTPKGHINSQHAEAKDHVLAPIVQIPDHCCLPVGDLAVLSKGLSRSSQTRKATDGRLLGRLEEIKEVPSFRNPPT